MEVDSKYESSKSSLSSSLSYPYTKLRMFRSLSNNFNRNIQYYGTNEHLKRVHPSSAGGGGGSKEVTNNNLKSGDDNNLISYEHLSESSSSSLVELVLPLTIFAITIIAVLFIAFILFVWIRKTFRENPGREFVSKKKQKQEKILEQLCRVKGGNSLVGTKRCEKVKNYNKLGNNKMNSRKWLRENTKQIVDNSAVVSDDIEQRKRETVEFKTTPPNSPKELQQDDDDDNDEEAIGGYESEPRPEIIHEMEKSNPFACPMTISDISVASIIQPRAACDSPPAQSSLALLHEELHCIQPKEEKIFKSIATSPPPFSPLIAQYHSLHHKYATTGTQTYFTKAPNSPNLLSSQFAVLQTPTTAGVASNPFILSPSDSNKENKEPTKLRNICLNKSITTSSSASSPSSVISTSPKVNTNVLQQQNSPLESPNNRFNFSPKILLSTPPASGSSRVIAGMTTSTGSSPISSTMATYKIGNYFRFPDIETPPVVAAISTRKHDDHQNVPSTLRKTFENLSIDESAAMASEKESIILKIDEVESPTPEEKSPTSVGCRRAGETGNNNNNNNYNINNNNYENTLTIRRARLKSISLDSDGARLVEENLTMPVEELVEIASSAYSNKQIRDSESESDVYSAAAQSCANNNNRFNPKNIYNLTINLDHRDSSLDICSSSVSDINMNQRDHDDDDDSGSEFIEDEICRTPTIKNFQQMKAVSLDSDQNQQHQTSSQSSKNMMHGVCKMASSETYSYYFGTGNAKNSISVPSTPKHLTSNKLKISSSEERSGTSTISGHGYSHRYSSSRKLGSFDENPDDANKLHVTSHVQQSSNSSKANLTAQVHHKYATTGTQTYFTKAPNSPNLLSSQFAVLQTPTTAGVASNPFILSPSDSNKENKEPTKLRNICLNKSITTSSSASSPSSVISTSPKVNTNVLQQQNSPLESPNNRFNFSPKILLSTPPASGSSRVIAGMTTSTGSSPISSTMATYKIGNYFRFPDIETPPVVAAISTRKHDDHQNVPSTLRKTFENLSIDESAAMASEKESIILKIDEVESPTPEEKSPTSVGCRRAGETGNNNNNNNYNINNNNYENTLTIRRARLKSISLDSDGARLVEENLTMPVEELVEIASSAYSNKQIRDSESESDVYSAAAQSCANNNNRFNPKNIYNLTINLDHRDSSLDICSSSVSDINMNQRDHDDDDDSGSEFIEDEICRTPTIKNFQQMKAVSLDSDQNQQHQTSSQSSKNMMHGVCKMASSETYSYYFGTGNAKNSISVPSTPKHLTSNKLKISSSEERSGTSTISGHGYSHRYSSSRKLGSFDENPDDANKLHVTSHVQQSSNSSKANLTASFQTLNVSSSNLKTLPEIMSINDFDQQTKPSGPSQRITPVPPQLMSSSKSGILQRRGSNHSLTLNLDGSCGNLMRGLSCSNYSLGNIHSSHLNIATTSGGSNYNLQGQQHHQQLQSRLKKNLLQRRGSNTSLTLNIQGSNNNLNRFNSHSSLNITGSTSTALQQQQRKGGLLERRNSNASLTLNIQNRGLSISNCNLRGSECSLSSVNTNQMNEIIMLEQEVEDAASHQTTKTHQRKFLSSENLHHIRSTAMSIGGCHRQQKDDPTPYGSVDKLACSQLENVPVISTKPLSPQSTSEDFKIYLANIQFLQSASNVLDEAQLKDLNTLFLKSYKNQSKDHSACGQKQFNNDDVLNNKIDPVSLVTFEAARKTESLDIQRELLVKLHQEFWNLPTNYQEKPMVFGSQSKNRYKSILPNEHSRVILQREDGAQQESYINANYIKGHDYASDCYIATQGPMQNTIFEFWLMVMQNMQGCQKIAMLTDFIESQRSKCAIYFPQDLNKCEVFTNTSATPDENFIRDNLDTIVDRNEKLEANFNYFVVKNEQIMAKNGYTIRKLLLIYGNSQAEVHQTFSIYHYWFPDWPDHRSPQDIDVLLDLSLDLLDGDCKKDFGVIDEEKRSRNEKNPLPIIHCSAGIGRTGCLAAILNGLGQIRANSSSNYGDGTSVDVLGIVCNLRLQRGGMVQNSEQYELIHRSLCLYYQKLSQKVLNL